MRPGQLARKYNIPVQDILSYLETEVSPGETFHPNSRLNEEMEAQIFDYFDVTPEEPEPEIVEEAMQEVIEDIPAETEVLVEPMGDNTETETEETAAVTEHTETEIEEELPKIPTPTLPSTPEEEIALMGGEIELGPRPAKEEPKDEVLEEDLPEPMIEVPIVKEEKEAPKEDEVIDTDRLMELLENEDTPPNLEKIKLIKATKKELSGLKVLGKIEVPEPERKEKKKEEADKSQEKKSEPDPAEKAERARLRAEQREKHRLLTKKKEEERRIRDEKRKKEKEERERKAIREAHYKQKLKRAKTAQPKSQPTKTEAPQQQEVAVAKQRSQPKTLLGKWWRWMNT
ncbi:MAG: hypothetical protein RIM99_08655 [Cyclobacteriaceae bacterium]